VDRLRHRGQSAIFDTAGISAVPISTAITCSDAFALSSFTDERVLRLRPAEDVALRLRRAAFFTAFVDGANVPADCPDSISATRIPVTPPSAFCSVARRSGSRVAVLELVVEALRDTLGARGTSPTVLLPAELFAYF
jgi:hypothetical protein